MASRWPALLPVIHEEPQGSVINAERSMNRRVTSLITQPGVGCAVLAVALTALAVGVSTTDGALTLHAQNFSLKVRFREIAFSNTADSVEVVPLFAGSPANQARGVVAWH